MTRRYGRGWSRCLPLLVALLACQGERGRLRLGLALSLSEAGVLPMKLGAELAVGEINAAGGIRRRSLELVERDDFGELDSAVSIAADFYQSDVVAVIGGAYSGLTLAAAPVYNGGRRPLVQLSPSASSPLLTSSGDFTFRLCPSDLAYGAALARFATERGLLRASVLYVNDEYGRGFRRTFTAEFVRYGGEVIDLDPFPTGQPDVSPYLARISKQRRAQFVVLAANQDEGLPVLRQLRAAKLGIPILAGDGMVGAERTNPTLMEGAYVSSAYLVGDARERNRQFVTAYQKAYPDAGPPDQGAAASYDAVYLLARVLQEAGTDRARVQAALARVGSASPAFDGVVGQVVFDAAGDAPTLEVQVGVARRGVLVPAGNER